MRDVVIVGAGPAGLALAAGLGRLGVRDALVLDRDDEPGGIPRTSDHPGYGLRDLHRSMRGPRYAGLLAERAMAAGASIETNATVTSIDGTSVEVTSPRGRQRIDARALVLATGCRERPRSARLIPGDRAAGIMTTGQLQRAVHLEHAAVGKAAVVLGAEHVSYSAVLTLAEAGCRTVAMVTAADRPESYAAFDLGARLRYRLPVLTGTQVARIEASGGRVRAVHVVDPDGRERAIACDTVITTGDWIAEHELARMAGLAIDDASSGVRVDASGRTSAAGTFAIGNLVHPPATADLCALGGAAAARAVAGWLASGTWPAAGPAIVAGHGLAWVSPASAGGSDGQVLAMASERLRMPRVTVAQGGSRLWQGRLPWLVPTRPARIDASWLARVDLAGPDVIVAAGP